MFKFGNTSYYIEGYNNNSDEGEQESKEKSNSTKNLEKIIKMLYDMYTEEKNLRENYQNKIQYYKQLIEDKNNEIKKLKEKQIENNLIQNIKSKQNVNNKNVLQILDVLKLEKYEINKIIVCDFITKNDVEQIFINLYENIELYEDYNLFLIITKLTQEKVKVNVCLECDENVLYWKKTILNIDFEEINLSIKNNDITVLNLDKNIENTNSKVVFNKLDFVDNTLKLKIK